MAVWWGIQRKFFLNKFQPPRIQSSSRENIDENVFTDQSYYKICSDKRPQFISLY